MQGIGVKNYKHFPLPRTLVLKVSYRRWRRRGSPSPPRKGRSGGRPRSFPTPVVSKNEDDGVECGKGSGIGVKKGEKAKATTTYDVSVLIEEGDDEGDVAADEGADEEGLHQNGTTVPFGEVDGAHPAFIADCHLINRPERKRERRTERYLFFFFFFVCSQCVFGCERSSYSDGWYQHLKLVFIVNNGPIH